MHIQTTGNQRRQDQCFTTCGQRDTCWSLIDNNTAFHACICTTDGLAGLDACNACRTIAGLSGAIDETATQQLKNDCVSLGYPVDLGVASSSSSTTSDLLPSATETVETGAQSSHTPATTYSSADAGVDRARIGAIAGGAIAGMLVILAAVVILCRRRVQQRRELKKLQPRRMIAKLDLEESCGRPSKEFAVLTPPLPKPAPASVHASPTPVVRILHPFSIASSSFLPDDDTMTDPDAASPTLSSRYWSHFSSHSRSDSITAALLSTADPDRDDGRDKKRSRPRRNRSDPSLGLIPPLGKSLFKSDIQVPQPTVTRSNSHDEGELQRRGSPELPTGARPGDRQGGMTEKQRLALDLEGQGAGPGPSSVRGLRLNSPLESPAEDDEEDLPPPSYSMVSKRRSSRFYQMFQRVSNPPPLPTSPPPPMPSSPLPRPQS